MKAAWIKICEGTSALEVPGGVLVRSYVEGSPISDVNGESSHGESVAVCMAFVPGAGIDCSKMDETDVGKLKIIGSDGQLHDFKRYEPRHRRQKK